MSDAIRRRRGAGGGRGDPVSRGRGPGGRGGGGGGGARPEANPANRLSIPGVVRLRPLPPGPDEEELARYREPELTPTGRALMEFKLSKQRNRQVQQLVYE